MACIFPVGRCLEIQSNVFEWKRFSWTKWEKGKKKLKKGFCPPALICHMFMLLPWMKIKVRMIFGLGQINFWYGKWLLNWSPTQFGCLNNMKNIVWNGTAENIKCGKKKSSIKETRVTQRKSTKNWNQGPRRCEASVLTTATTANAKIRSKLVCSTTYVSPAGPAQPPGRPRKSWRGWSRSTPRRADLWLARTPHAPHPGRSSACWPTRHTQE